MTTDKTQKLSWSMTWQFLSFVTCHGQYYNLEILTMVMGMWFIIPLYRNPYPLSSQPASYVDFSLHLGDSSVAGKLVYNF